MTACPSCANENPEGSRFCNRCGTELQASPVREERKVITALFCDLVGSTALGERLDVEDISRLLLDYQRICRDRIESHGGVVEKFIGDAVVGVFGVPAAHEDDPERAVRAALWIVDDVGASDLPIEVRIGVNTGEALVRLDVDPRAGVGFATGDTMNTAARLEAAAPVMGVAVGEQTHRATADRIDYEDLPPLSAKGKAAPLSVWRATRPRAHVGIPERDSTPFVGRDLELSVLTRLFERSRAQSSVEFVTIVADPGLGKSRLVRELARHVDALPESITWRQGRCLPYGEGISFWALGEIIKSHAGIFDTDDQATLSMKLDRVITVPDESLRSWMKDRIAPLVGLETPIHPPEQEEAFNAWRGFLERVASDRPTVLVIEDLHWADDALVAFLQHLSERTTDLPILVITTARPEVEERHPTWLGDTRRSTVLSLTTLAHPEMNTLVEALLDGLTPELVTTVLERAGGSPLYAEQFAAMLKDQAMPIAGGSLDESAIPPTIQALLAARIDQLPPKPKALLLDASVIGKVFWFGAVATLADGDRTEIEAHLAELSRRSFIRPVFPSTMEGEPEFTFLHALVRDVAYSELPRPARMTKHRATALWITDEAGEALGGDAEIVVAHLDHALELADAIGATEEAAAIGSELVDALLVSAAHSRFTVVARTKQHLGYALSLMGEADARRPPALGQLGRVLHVLGDYAEAIGSFREAIAAFREGGDEITAATLSVSLAACLYDHGQAETAGVVLADAEDVLRTDPGPGLVDALTMEAWRSMVDLKPGEAIVVAREALDLARTQGLAEPPRALALLGDARMELGDEGGADDLARAADLALVGGDLPRAARTYHSLAARVYDTEGPGASLALLDRAIEIAGRVGGLTYWAVLGGRLPNLLSVGRWDELLEEAEEVVAFGVRTGDVQTRLNGEVQSLRVRLERGIAAGDPLAIASLARARGDRIMLGFALPHAIELGRIQGDDAVALTLFQELARSAEDGKLFEAAPAVRAGLRLGEVAASRRLIEGRDALIPVDRYDNDAAEALLLEAEGDLRGARVAFARCVGEWRAFGDVVEEAYALGGLGRCLIGLGEPEEGVARLKESRAIWERLRAAPRIAEIDELLASLTSPLGVSTDDRLPRRGLELQ